MHAQYQPIVERFHADETFRQAVLADANGAVKREFGIDLPGQMRVVAEGDGYRIEPVASANGDLNDEQLDLVAGGNGKGGGPPLGRPIDTRPTIVCGPPGGGRAW
jgi:hypothetical protein